MDAYDNPRWVPEPSWISRLRDLQVEIAKKDGPNDLEVTVCSRAFADLAWHVSSLTRAGRSIKYAVGDEPPIQIMGPCGSIIVKRGK